MTERLGRVERRELRDPPTRDEYEPDDFDDRRLAERLGEPVDDYGLEPPF